MYFDFTAQQLANFGGPEAEAVIRALLAEIERLKSRLAELEPRKSPRNPSLPPSTEHPHAKPGERALRHGVIWRKLSFGTQSVAGSRFVANLLTVIETCRQQDRPVLDDLTAAVAAHFARTHCPSLILNP